MANFNLNKVILAGRLTSDLELKQTPNGVSVVSGSIAVNRKQKDANNQTIADFFNFVAWRGTAETLSKYLKKGSSVCLIGNLQNRAYTDAQGVKRYITELIVEEAKFVDSKPLNTDNGQEYQPDYKNASPSEFEAAEGDGDLPF